MIQETLRTFGLSEKEIKVYLALIDIGSTVASVIARKSGINRSTTYIILDTLIERGLVSTAEHRGVKRYNPAPADQLVKHLKAQAKKYETFADAAKKLVPQLKAKQGKTQTKPRVQVYEGAEGIRTVYEDTLSSLEGIRAHAMKKGSVKTAPVTKDDFGRFPEITVQGNKIILVSPGEKFAAVVESAELAEKLQKVLRSANKESQKGFSLKPKRA